MADVIDALIAEALGEGPEGIAAVAHVIQQRALATGKTPEQIVNEAGQFSGVTNPGRAVAQAMNDPATRAQVEQIWSGVQSGQIPNPYPGANYFHTPSVNPSWSGEYKRLGQLGNHIFYSDGTPVAAPAAPRRVEPTMPVMRPADTAVAAIEQAAPSNDWLTYSNQGATRSLPISNDLIEAMAFLPELGVTMDVYSGGQEAEGPKRVGSTRHDHGNAADVMFYKDGRMLDWNNPDDLPLLSDIVARAKAGGVTGIGAGDDYMGPGRFHVGFGNPAVWGAGGKSANAPDWLRSAYYGAWEGGMGAKPQAIPAVMRGPAKPGGGIWSNIMAPIKTAMAGAGAPLMRAASNPNVQREMVGNMFGTVGGRTAIVRALMNQNIGSAPTISQGHSGGGTRALAVTGGNAAPVTLMRTASRSDSNSDGSNPANMNRDIYRANAAVLGSGGFTQPNIDRVMASGKTLYKLA